jgi:hypothetical protein
MKKDYSYLKGVEFDVFDWDKKKRRCFVVDIDYDKGITCKGDLNTKGKLSTWICLNKANTDRGRCRIPKEGYRKAFNFYVQAIERGRLYFGRVPYEGNGTLSDCAFE